MNGIISSTVHDNNNRTAWNEMKEKTTVHNQKRSLHSKEERKRQQIFVNAKCQRIVRPEFSLKVSPWIDDSNFRPTICKYNFANEHFEWRSIRFDLIQFKLNRLTGPRFNSNSIGIHRTVDTRSYTLQPCESVSASTHAEKIHFQPIFVVVIVGCAVAVAAAVLLHKIKTKKNRVRQSTQEHTVNSWILSTSHWMLFNCAFNWTFRSLKCKL